MQSNSVPVSKLSAKELFLYNSVTYYLLADFLNSNEHQQMASVNKTFLNFQKSFYQVKLTSLERKLGPNLSPETDNQLAAIPFPTSAYLFSACKEAKKAPAKFIKDCKYNFLNSHYISLLGTSDAYRIDLFNNITSPAYQLLDILIKVGNYDINENINNRNSDRITTFHNLLMKPNQNPHTKKMIRYCLTNPSLTKATATEAFRAALNDKLLDIDDKKSVVPMTEILDSKKIDLAVPELGCDLLSFTHYKYSISPNLKRSKAYIALFKAYQPNLSFKNAIETILIVHREESFDHLEYILESKHVNLELVCQNETSPILNLLKYVQNINAFIKILNLFERYFPKIPYPANLFEQLIQCQGYQPGENPKHCVARISKFLNSDKLYKKFALTSAKIEDVIKHTFNESSCHMENYTALLKAYLSSHARLLKIAEEKSEYQGGVSLFGKQFGGVSKQTIRMALDTLIKNIENVSISSNRTLKVKTSNNHFTHQYKELNPQALITAYPILNQDPGLITIMKLIDTFLKTDPPTDSPTPSATELDLSLPKTSTS